LAFAVADGIVRYSAFSPTWTDADKHVHWNLGNVIVIEHALDQAVVLLGVERLPGHDAQHAGGHDKRKRDDHGRRWYPPQRPAGVWGISMGHVVP